VRAGRGHVLAPARLITWPSAPGAPGLVLGSDSCTNNGASVVDITFFGGLGDDRFENNGLKAGTLYTSRRRWDRDGTACDRFSTTSYGREIGSYRAATDGYIT